MASVCEDIEFPLSPKSGQHTSHSSHNDLHEIHLLFKSAVCPPHHTISISSTLFLLPSPFLSHLELSPIISPHLPSFSFPSISETFKPYPPYKGSTNYPHPYLIYLPTHPPNRTHSFPFFFFSFPSPSRSFIHSTSHHLKRSHNMKNMKTKLPTPATSQINFCAEYSTHMCKRKKITYLLKLI